MNLVKLIFVLLVVFQFKHFIADYILQAHPFFLGKFRKDWSFLPPLLAHVSIHAVFTFNICRVFGDASISKSVLLALFDATIHFFMDRIKAGEKYMGRWKPLTGAEYMTWYPMLSWKDPINQAKARRALRSNTLFWICLGFDQLVHHLTDIAVIWYLVK